MTDKKTAEEILENTLFRNWGQSFYNFSENQTGASFASCVKPLILEAMEEYASQFKELESPREQNKSLAESYSKLQVRLAESETEVNRFKEESQWIRAIYKLWN